ncbi:MAG: pentapeptide repeat-containing protein, partial [Candidatus Hydrothermarchaeales archaeon]
FFLLIIIITFQALFTTTNPLHASCNQSEDPDNIFKIHGIGVASVKMAILPDVVKFPKDLKKKIYYRKSRQLLIFSGIMSNKEKDKLLNLSTDELYKKAIEALFKRNQENIPKIEGECLNELLRAMGEGKDIDIEFAEIKGDIDFTNPKFFPTYSFDEATEKELLSHDEIAYVNRVKKNFPYKKHKIVLVKGKIRITNSVIEKNIITNNLFSLDTCIIFFKDSVNFRRARFAGEANFRSAQFAGKANFRSAQFAGKANFWHANLSGADLYDAALRKVNLRGTNLDAVRFELKPGVLPLIPDIAHAKNLSKMRYEDSPTSLVELRKAFKVAGYRRQEREITYAIEYTRTRKQMRGEEDIGGVIKGLFKCILFEVTSDYGMSPGRPLWIMIFLTIFFSVLYEIALKNTQGRAGIWKVWQEDRVLKVDGQKVPVRLCASEPRWTSCFAFYFSMLSAFRIGWREINAGHWIVRMQGKEYTLRATGWVRTVAGVQSLISVYLMALSVLTYFGRPFEL